jgi:hypothetical protein
MMGDFAGAIEDLQYLFEGEQPDSAAVSLIEALRAGRDPFTSEVLEELRNQ